MNNVFNRSPYGFTEEQVFFCAIKDPDFAFRMRATKSSIVMTALMKAARRELEKEWAARWSRGSEHRTQREADFYGGA